MASTVSPCIVVDNGSSCCKAGFSSEETPKVNVRSVYGHPRDGVSNSNEGLKDCYVGSEAQELRDVLALKYPIESGIVTDWDGLHKIYDHIFSVELKVLPEERRFLLTESARSYSRANKEKVAQLMFETFHVEAACLHNQAPLALGAEGRTTGLSFQSGDSDTSVVPVYEGYVLPHAIKHTPLSGRDVTQHLGKLLTKNGKASFPPTTSSYDEHNVLKDAKESFAYVAISYDWETNETCDEKVLEKSYQLPDGNTITVSMGTKECCTCTEILFEPRRCGFEGVVGVHEMINESAKMCDSDIRKDLFGNIVVSGGNTLLRGFGERLLKEMVGIVMPPPTRVKVIAPPHREELVWRGGSIMSSLDSFSEFVVTKKDYDEGGNEVVYKTWF